MAKYRKKPVVIEAVQFTKKTKDQSLNWATNIQGNVHPDWDSDGKPVLLVPTLEGEMICRLGDYLIKGVQGELYPCKPDIFEQTYELVSD